MIVRHDVGPAQADTRQPWHARAPDEVVRALDTGDDGLSEADAGRRLERSGPNELQHQESRSDLAILLGQFRSPLVSLLLVAGAVALVVGELVDAGFIAAVLVLNATVGFWQERQAARSLEALRELAAPQARVVRDGRERSVPGREVVPGDVVVLSVGDRVPADVRVTEASRLECDESLLTGESTSARKRPDPVDEETPLGDRLSLAFMGTHLAGGAGRGVVVATGMDTELGHIMGDVLGEEEPRTPLEERMRRLADTVGVAVLAASAVAVAVGLLRGTGWSELLLAAVALAVGAIPEGLPVTFTVALALGVRRMARRRALIRRLPAVETLGSTTVIAADKTGTLTRNRMTVETVWAAGEAHTLPPEDDAEPPDRPGGAPEPGNRHEPVDATGNEALRLAFLTGVLSNAASLELGEEQGVEAQGDPTETALLWAARRVGLDPSVLRDDHDVVLDLPFDPARLYSAAVVSDGDGLLLVVKGAPERLAERCAGVAGADGERRLGVEAALEANDRFATRGLRVLGMAVKRIDPAEVPDDPEDLDPHGLLLVGLQGMVDPPRPGVPESIEACHRAGIRVVMVTGDHASTATAIAREVGIATGDEPSVLVGSDVAAMDDEELRARVREVDVYARTEPSHKLRIVHALQAGGEVAAVTGDGVNDAPALKAAEIGVAMGRSGTDVARESADMVLADDDFVSIREAVEEGRVTFDNVRKVTFFLLAPEAGIVLLVVAGLGLGWGLVLLPAQLLWLNLVTNGIQDLALAFEPGEPGVLDRPPRRRGEGILSRRLWERTLLVAVTVATATGVLFDWSLSTTGDATQARSVAVTALVVLSAVQLFNSRSEHRSVFRVDPFGNRLLFAGQAVAVAVHVAALHLPFTRFVLRVEAVPAGAWWRILLFALPLVAVNELHKRWRA